jgi:hypothetical protein
MIDAELLIATFGNERVSNATISNAPEFHDPIVCD